MPVDVIGNQMKVPVDVIKVVPSRDVFLDRVGIQGMSVLYLIADDSPIRYVN
jgi:GTP cyclohydrolase FolE2